jgi:hypothetical protein
VTAGAALVLWTVSYYRIAPAEFAKRRLTHVCTQGVVTLKKHEGDKDWHYRVADGKDYIVAEVSPRTPLPTAFSPKIGDRVEVCGTRRYDDAPGHGWWEVHPVESGRVVGGKQ